MHDAPAVSIQDSSLMGVRVLWDLDRILIHSNADQTHFPNGFESYARQKPKMKTFRETLIITWKIVYGQPNESWEI